MAGDQNELFAQLLEYSWKGVSFPSEHFRMTLRHDLAPHKYCDSDGANVESTGLAPLQFSAHIKFRNGTVPGKNETWGVLYPTQFRSFIEVASKGTTGVLNHPEFGEVACKLESCDVAWAADRRDGCDVDVVWLQTIVEGDTSFAANPSPIADIILGATDLDAQLGSVSPPFPALPVYTPDLAAAFRSITAFTDQVSLLSKRAVGKVAALKYRIDTMSDSIDRVGESLTPTTVPQILNADTTGAAQRALLWPMRQSVERMRSSMVDVERELGSKGRQVLLYIVPQDSTLAGVAQDLGAELGDIMSLNPGALASPVVKMGSSIRHYAA